MKKSIQLLLAVAASAAVLSLSSCAMCPKGGKCCGECGGKTECCGECGGGDGGGCCGTGGSCCKGGAVK